MTSEEDERNTNRKRSQIILFAEIILFYTHVHKGFTRKLSQLILSAR